MVVGHTYNIYKAFKSYGQCRPVNARGNVQHYAPQRGTSTSSLWINVPQREVPVALVTEPEFHSGEETKILNLEYSYLFSPGGLVYR